MVKIDPSAKLLLLAPIPAIVVWMLGQGLDSVSVLSLATSGLAGFVLACLSVALTHARWTKDLTTIKAVGVLTFCLSFYGVCAVLRPMPSELATLWCSTIRIFSFLLLAALAFWMAAQQVLPARQRLAWRQAGRILIANSALNAGSFVLGWSWLTEHKLAILVLYIGIEMCLMKMRDSPDER